LRIETQRVGRVFAGFLAGDHREWTPKTHGKPQQLDRYEDIDGDPT